MLISEFARNAELSVDAVRHYVKLGLLEPELSVKGGSNPYQIFSLEHIETARLIRVSQALGFSLKEISTLAKEYHSVEKNSKRVMDILRSQIVQLQVKADQLDNVLKYLRAKVDWLEKGAKGKKPRF